MKIFSINYLNNFKDNPVLNLDSNQYPLKIIAKFSNASDPNAQILIQNEALVDVNGFANFSYLAVSSPMESFTIEYYLDLPYGVNS